MVGFRLSEGDGGAMGESELSCVAKGKGEREISHVFKGHFARVKL